MKVIIVSGGTGGHIYPGIAIADEIKRRDLKTEILFIGSQDGLEKELVTKAGYDLKLIKSRALLRKISYKAISAPFVSAIGFFQALFLLARNRPKVVISTGGYASLPVVLAAKLLRIPIVLHEQNVLPGAVNRFCKGFATKVFLSFPESEKYLKGEVVGNPVRQEILKADKESARKTIGLDPDDKVVLIMGGSQGSKKINETVISSLYKLPSRMQILHIVGTRDFGWVSRYLEGKEINNYYPMPYLHKNIAAALAAADLAVSRAGATAIAEFLARGLPMILIPFPYAAEDHQMLNAKAIAQNDAAVIAEDKELTPEKFIELITDSTLNYAKMGAAAKALAKRDSAERIVNYIYEQ
jgi:UDP-N-acetylglucosamine--N-acetylmuramyl-(pentapeptide) pyrophosphoryl-undecaprenol N-acetylglucosamine transferase